MFFTCVSSKASIVSKVEEEIYILKHVSGTLELVCQTGANQTIELSEKHKLGAIQILTACNCKLMLDREKQVSESYPSEDFCFRSNSYSPRLLVQVEV